MSESFKVKHNLITNGNFTEIHPSNYMLNQSYYNFLDQGAGYGLVDWIGSHLINGSTAPVTMGVIEIDPDGALGNVLHVQRRPNYTEAGNSVNLNPDQYATLSQRFTATKNGHVTLKFYSARNRWGDQGDSSSSNIVEIINIDNPSDRKTHVFTDYAQGPVLDNPSEWTENSIESFKVKENQDYWLHFMGNTGIGGGEVGSIICDVRLTYDDVKPVKTDYKILSYEVDGKIITDIGSVPTIKAEVKGYFPKITFTVVDAAAKNKPVSNLKVDVILDNNRSGMLFDNKARNFNAITDHEGKVTSPYRIYAGDSDNEIYFHVRLAGTIVDFNPTLHLVNTPAAVVTYDNEIKVKTRSGENVTNGEEIFLTNGPSSFDVSVYQNKSPNRAIAAIITAKSSNENIKVDDAKVDSTAEKPATVFVHNTDGTGTLVFTAEGAKDFTVKVNISSTAKGHLTATPSELWLTPGTKSAAIGELALLEVEFNPLVTVGLPPNINFTIEGEGLSIIKDNSPELHGFLTPVTHIPGTQDYSIIPQLKIDDGAQGSAKIIFSVDKKYPYASTEVKVNFSQVDHIKWNVSGDVPVSEGQVTSLNLGFQAFDKVNHNITASPLRVTITTKGDATATFPNNSSEVNINRIEKNNNFVVPEMTIGTGLGELELKVFTPNSTTALNEILKVIVGSAQIATSIEWHPKAGINVTYEDVSTDGLYASDYYLEVFDAGRHAMKSGKAKFTINAPGNNATFDKNSKTEIEVNINGLTGHAKLPLINVSSKADFEILAKVESVSGSASIPVKFK